MANFTEKIDQLKALFSKNKEVLKKVGIKFESTVTLGASALTKDGKTLSTDADAWGAGVSVFIYDEASDSTTPVEDGSYELENGDTIVVEGGMVKEIVPVAAAEMSQEDLASLVESAQELATAVETLEAEKTSLSAQVATLEAEKVDLSKKITELSKKPAVVSLSKVAETVVSPKPQTVKDKVLASMTAMEQQ